MGFDIDIDPKLAFQIKTFRPLSNLRQNYDDGF